MTTRSRTQPNKITQTPSQAPPGGGEVLLGGLFGAAIGGPSGALVGALFGAVASQKPSLEQRLSEFFSPRGVTVSSVHRVGRLGAKVVIVRDGVHWLLEARAPEQLANNRAAVDDALLAAFTGPEYDRVRKLSRAKRVRADVRTS